MRFGQFSFDPATDRLSRDGEAVALGQRAAKLLGVLLTHPGEIVHKDALMDAAWPGQAVEESNLTVQMAALRRALGTTPEGREWIATVPRLGYRFINAASSPAGDKPKPSIAVLAFTNLSSDAEQDYFAAGLAEDLITDLSKVRGLTVISRDSSFAFKDAAELDSIARELGVQYLVRGSVRRAADRVRINAWLIDAAEHSPIWADRFDGDLADVFALQDRVVAKLVTALAGALPVGVAPKPRRQPNIDAYDVFVRGRQIVMLSPHANLEACSLFERAVAIDPPFADAYAWLAMGLVHGRRTFGRPVENFLERAVTAGRRAVELDPESADAHAFLGYALGFDMKPEEAAAEVATAIRLNPNHADALTIHAQSLVNRGEALQADEAMRRAMQLNPYPPAWYRWLLGYILFAGGRYGEAVEALSHESLRGTGAARILAASYAQLGRPDDAKAAAEAFLAVVPNFRISEWMSGQPIVDNTVRQRFLEGYRRARLPE